MSENEDTGQKDGGWWRRRGGRQRGQWDTKEANGDEENSGGYEGQTYGAGTSPLILSLPLHLSLTHTLPLFTPTYTHVYAAGMPMRCEQSEHEAMQQFDCSGSLPRQTQTPQRQWALLEAFCEGKTKCLTLIMDRLLKFRNTLITLKERVRLFPFRLIFFDVQCPLPYRF